VPQRRGCHNRKFELPCSILQIKPVIENGTHTHTHTECDSNKKAIVLLGKLIEESLHKVPIVLGHAAVPLQKPRERIERDKQTASIKCKHAVATRAAKKSTGASQP